MVRNETMELGYAFLIGACTLLLAVYLFDVNPSLLSSTPSENSNPYSFPAMVAMGGFFLIVVSYFLKRG